MILNLHYLCKLYYKHEQGIGLRTSGCALQGAFVLHDQLLHQFFYIVLGGA